MNRPPVSFGKKIFLITGTFVVSLLLLLAALELGLRIVGFSPTFINPLNSFHDGDTMTGWRGRPDIDARFKRQDFDVRVVMDKQGFRAPAHGVEVSPQATPLWILGDSFTWGWGVDQSEVFTDQLQKLVGGDKYRVINRGINGTGTLQQSLLLEKSMEGQLKPGLLGIMVFRNDFDDNIYSQNDSRPFCRVDGEKVEIGNLPVANPIGGIGRDILSHSYALSFVVYIYHVARLSLHASQSEVQSFGFEDRDVPADAQQAMRFSLKRITALSAKYDIKPFVVYIPSVQELNMEHDSKMMLAVKKAAASAGMPMLDLIKPFSEAKDPRALYFDHDEHWTAKGHRLAAEAMQQFLQKQKFTHP